MSIGHLNVQSSNRRMDSLMPVSHANTSQQGCLIMNYFIIVFSRQKALPACEFYINWCQISIMSIGHTQMSNGPLDEKKCLLDTQMSIRSLDEQKCPVDIQMSIGHIAEVLDMHVLERCMFCMPTPLPLPRFETACS